jgi:hypothetical protein
MSIYDNIAKKCNTLIADEWTAQGHDLTGKFRSALTYVVREEDGSTKIDLIDGTSGYGVILNKGVTADRIPFSPGSGRKTSKYIEGLARYAKLRMGASDKDAVSIAFAIAHTHKAEGMPSQGSRRYSSTGERTQFVQAVEDKFKAIIEEELRNGYNLNNNSSD